MIGRLLSSLDLPQRDLCICSGTAKHFAEKLIRHEMRARAGSQITAARKKLHSLQIDFLIKRKYVFFYIERNIEKVELKLKLAQRKLAAQIFY